MRPARKSQRLFLFVVSALPPGDGGEAARRVLLVFVTGEDIHSAMADGQTELHRLGWRGGELQGMKELPPDAAAEPDETAREAIQRALHAGFAFIAYL